MQDAPTTPEQEKEDHSLLMLAMTRVASDSGRRSSLEDVATELAIDLDSLEKDDRPGPNESTEPSLLDFAIARVTEDSNERQAMKAVATELGVGDTTENIEPKYRHDKS